MLLSSEVADSASIERMLLEELERTTAAIAALDPAETPDFLKQVIGHASIIVAGWQEDGGAWRFGILREASEPPEGDCWIAVIPALDEQNAEDLKGLFS